MLDTCVLYPATLRDVLLTVAEHGLYRPLWSADIISELQGSLNRRPGSDPAAIFRLTSEMTAAFEDAMVADYEPLISSMTNDAKDRHVLAAAVRANADAIVTYNLKDFPTRILEPLGIEAHHPDEFLLNQLDLHPHRVLGALQMRVSTNRRPPVTVAELADTLERLQLPESAAALRDRS